MGSVRQRFQDPAVGDPIAAARGDHAFQVGLEGPQPGDAAPHIFEVSPRDPGHRRARLLRVAGKLQELTDGGLREAELTAVPDEGEARAVPGP